MIQSAERRREILLFCDKFGFAATAAAFGVSRATVYRWKKRAARGFLAGTSTAPKQVRVPIWSPVVLAEIERLRLRFPQLGKRKLTPLLALFCQEHGLTSVSEATVGRMIQTLLRRRRIPDNKRYSWYARQARWRPTRIQSKVVKQRRAGYVPEKAGDLVAIDAVVLFANGVKRYILTAIDYSSSFAFAYTYKTLSSRTATDFLGKLQTVAPFPITRVQTDNGGEFHKEFHAALEKKGITHFYTYPRRPQMNGKLERFNRTIQEEFSEHQWATIQTDLDMFNLNLVEWLLWYNGVRPHEALGMLCPLQYLIRKEDLSHMSWSCTQS